MPKCSKCKKTKDDIDFLSRRIWKTCNKCREKTPNPVRRGVTPLSSHKLSKEWNPRNICLLSKYSQGSSKKVWWICLKDHEWEAIIKNRTKLGSGCPYCSGRKAGYGHSLADKDRGDVCKEWNYSKNSKKPKDYTPTSQKKIWWICAKGHDYEAKICHRTNGSTCPYCAKRKVGHGNSLKDNDRGDICKEWNHKRNSKGPEQYLPTSSKKVWWVCSKSHEWESIISNRTNGSNCPTCRESKGEKYISEYLETKGIIFERQKTFKSLRRYRYDFFIPALSLIVEYDGQQHFDPENYFNKKGSLEKTKARDNTKIVFAAENGHSIFRISSCMFKHLDEIIDRFLEYFSKNVVTAPLFVYTHHLENSKAKEIYREQRTLFFDTLT